MKQKYRYLACLLTTLVLQTPSVHAQFNTIHEYGNQRTEKVQETRHKKSCQPTADSVMVDSLYRNPSTKNGCGVFGDKLMALPLKKIHVTSSFGRRTHPISKSIKIHNGIDLRARYEEVYSMFPGKIYRIGEDKISGKHIIVSTGNYLISYCHLSKIRVQQGSLISAGDIIGISGNSGSSTAPHLHITCKIKGKLINPKYVIDYIRSQQDNQ